jgi:very-short-patch-repair endonuclease
MIARWLESNRLHRVHRQVFAVGHTGLSIDGKLWAALLYASGRAVLSHTTAAWVWSLIDAEPRRIHVTIPGRLPSLPGVRVHHSREVIAAECRGLQVTPVARTLVDLGAMLTPRSLRRALAEADHQGLLRPSEVWTALKRGRAGSTALRRALRSHMPELAQTLSVLEERFLELCESSGLPLPEVNVKVGRMRIDALWRNQRLAVELDGGPSHGGAAAMKRDRQRDLALRAYGLRVVRYSWEQIVRHPELVVADLRRLLG